MAFLVILLKSVVTNQQGHKVLSSLSWCANWVTSDFFGVSCVLPSSDGFTFVVIVDSLHHRTIIWSMLKNMAIRLMLQEHLALFHHFLLLNWYQYLLHKHTFINQSVKMKNHSSYIIKSGAAFPCPFFFSNFKQESFKDQSKMRKTNVCPLRHYLTCRLSFHYFYTSYVFTFLQ